jgi:hypothetical protein
MHEPIDADAELAEVRSQIASANANVYPAGIVAEMDNLRAWIHDEARVRGLDPESAEYERAWVIAGVVMGRLLAHPNTATMFAKIENDNHRGQLASLLLWAAGISTNEAKAGTRLPKINRDGQVER